MTKSEILSTLSESSGFTKKEVAGLLEDLGNLIGKNLKKSGPGTFNIPGLMKVKCVRKPATKTQGHQPVYLRL